MTDNDIAALLLSKLPDVRAVSWRMIGSIPVARLQFKWYAWLTLEPLKAKTVHRAHAILDAAGVTSVLVETW